MTPREQIAKRRKPFLYGAVIGAAFFLAGLVLQHTVARPACFMWLEGRWPCDLLVSISLMISGYFIFVASTSIYSMRGSCPHCGRNMGSSVFRKINYCPFCSTPLDSELASNGVVTATAALQQRKEWIQQLVYTCTSLLAIALLIVVVLLFLRTLHLESERDCNAKAIGSFYARACRTPAGEETMRRIFKERLSRAERANCLGRLFLPTDEKKYTQQVLDTFEKELLLKQGRVPPTDGTTNLINHVTR